METNINHEPTPYPDVNETLRILLDEVRTILGSYFTGMYLYGSLALNSFLPDRSDIDFLVVTAGELTQDTIMQIKALHERLYDSGRKWAARLEGAYIPLAEMRVYDADGPLCLLVNGRVFIMARPDRDWVLNRHILRTSGVVVAGPHPRTFIEPVPPDALKSAVRSLLQNNWPRYAANADLLREGPGYPPYVVLTMCRALYTLEQGVVPTKQNAGEWALRNLDERWHPLIRESIDWRDGAPGGDIAATQDFMRYVFTRAGLHDGLGS